jgi:hypothetical protein
VNPPDLWTSHTPRDVVVEIAYLILCYCAWRWAVASIMGLRRYNHAGAATPWRWKATTWLTSKAVFFTFLGSVWWFNWFNIWIHTAAILLLALAHWAAYREWNKLPADYRPITGKPDERWPESRG